MLNFKEWFLTEGMQIKQGLKKFGNVDSVKFKVDKFVYTILGENIPEKKAQEITDWVTFWVYKFNEEEKVPDIFTYVDEFEKIIEKNKDFIAAEVNTINFKDADLKPEDLQFQSDNWHHNLAKNSKIGAKGAIGTPVLKFENGWQWISLDKKYCQIEGRAMGHCGNQAGKAGDNILSLRDPRNVPYLTFIVNHGELGESKGRFNDKPEPKFYPYIIKLLESPLVNTIRGGGYMAINNFSMYDLDRETRQELMRKKPQLVPTPTATLVSAYNNNRYPELLAWFLDHDNSDEYFRKFQNKDNQKDLDYYEQFEHIMRQSKYAPSVLAHAKMIVGRPLTTVDVRKLTEEAKGLNYIDNSDKYMSFLILLSKNYPDIFDKVFSNIEVEARREAIKYLIFHKIKINPKFYDDLTDEDVKSMSKRYQELDRKLPEELVKSRQIIDAEREHKLESLELRSIFIKILNKQELSKQQEAYFNSNCIISLNDFKEICEFYDAMLRDEVPDENVSDDVYNERVDAKKSELVTYLIPVFSPASAYGKDQDYPLCLSKQLQVFLRGLNWMLSNFSLSKELHLHLYQLFAPSIYTCLNDVYTQSQLRVLNNRLFYDDFPLVWKLISKLSAAVGKEFDIKDFIKR